MPGGVKVSRLFLAQEIGVRVPAGQQVKFGITNFMVNKLTEFQGEKVTYIETLNVKDGVVCDVYAYDGDKEKDLGVITVAPNTCTPLMKILRGDRTIDGFISGKGVLTIVRATGEVIKYTPQNEGEEFEMLVNETVQWCSEGEELNFYEICYPPYHDGRYENITD